MMSKFIFILSFFISFSANATRLGEHTKIEGYFDSDSQIDSITCVLQERNKIYACNLFSTKINKTTNIQLDICSYNDISSINKGEISLKCSWWGTETEFLFKYENKDWFLTKIFYDVLPMKGPSDPGWSREANNFTTQHSLGDHFKQMIRNIDASNEQLNYIQDDLKNNFILNQYREEKFYTELYERYPLQNDNVETYNNIAFYLDKNGMYSQASFVLEKIIKNYPKRTVAYINIGDVYWALQNYKGAKLAYSKYISLMKELKRENKIPKRVYERI